MDRRYQVFVSSTFFDLAEERAAVVSALLQLDAIPAGMELFPAADDDAWTLIKRVIDASDYYLLVVGGRYGSVDPVTELSFTEREFDYAVEAKKPVMAFLHVNPDAIPLGKSEKTEEAQAKLGAFRTKVEATKHVKYWNDASDLQGKVAFTFPSFINTYPAVGWIRGDVETAASALAELNDLRKQLDAAKAQLTTVRTSPPPGVEDLKQGGDRFEVTASASARSRSATTDQFGRPVYTTWTGSYDVDPTWDELFAVLGPSLLDEANQRDLHSRINTYLTTYWGNAYRRTLRAQIEEGGDSVEAFSRTELELDPDDFDTILVQFRALGLIQQSGRKHAISDKGTYWTLTPYGDTHLTTLRALRRESRDLEAAAVAENEEEEEE